MGPLITFAIFNQSKPQRTLATDFAVIGLLQAVALGYGLWTVFVARPVHLVFEYTRMSVVHAIEVDPNILTKAPASLQKLPFTGPTMAAIGGVPLAARSDLWRPYADSISDILKEAKPIEELRTRYAHHIVLIDHGIEDTGKPAAQLRYLPMVGRDNAWTVLLDATTAEPLGFLPLDSF
jgi:hypothetical protein